MTATLLTAAVGFGAGVLSGAFGVGGGVVTTPAIRLVLGYPGLIAVGTPLPVVLPAALAGAATHAWSGSARVRSGLVLGAWGIPTAALGAMASRVAGGTVVLLITAGLIVLVAIDLLRGLTGSPGEYGGEARRTWRGWALFGSLAGLYSGFLGLGGGFVLVPVLHRFFGLRLKEAIGTSLVAITVISVPGSITHWAIGNVDVPLAFALTIGAVPGAFLGARLTGVAREHHVRLAFALFLIVLAAILAFNEVGEVGVW